MPRTLAGFILPLAMPALLLPGKAVAEPPEGTSGKMVFDEVADGLRKYHREEEPGKRIWWLYELARTRDARVTIACGEALSCHDPAEVEWAAIIIGHYQFPERCHPQLDLDAQARAWWKENEADLRRRAKQLPQ
jgi:hypothetical protein